MASALPELGHGIEHVEERIHVPPEVDPLPCIRGNSGIPPGVHHRESRPSRPSPRDYPPEHRECATRMVFDTIERTSESLARHHHRALATLRLECHAGLVPAAWLLLWLNSGASCDDALFPGRTCLGITPWEPRVSRSSVVGWPRRPRRPALRQADRCDDGEPCASPMSPPNPLGDIELAET